MVSALVLLPALSPSPSAQARPSFGLDRIAGILGDDPDRYATAHDAAVTAFPGGSDVAVLARGDAFADAISGSFLAGALGAPVLLTRTGDLPNATISALADLDTTTVVVLGGPSAVSPVVLDQLRVVFPDMDVVVVSGEDRYATAAAAVRETGASAQDVPLVDGLRTALLVSGEVSADAVTASPLAYGAGLPLLLTGRDGLPPSTRELMADLSVEQVVVVGGAAAVSARVRADVAEATGHPVVPLSGEDRYATAATVAAYAYDELGFDPTQVDVVRGDDPADALAASALSGGRGAPYLLTRTGDLPPASRALLVGRCEELLGGYVLGGAAAVSAATVEDAVRAGGGCSPLDRITLEEVGQPRDLTAYPNSPGQTGPDDNRTFRVLGTEYGTVEYRVTLFRADRVDLTDPSRPVFTPDPDRPGTADTGSPTADVLVADDVLPAPDNDGPGTPYRREGLPVAPTAVFYTGYYGATFVLNGDLAPEQVVAVVHRNGAGSTDGSAARGGPTVHVDLAPDGTAAEAVAVTGVLRWTAPPP